MSYIRAEEVLPKELIETIQQYVNGKAIYIPSTSKKEWGSHTDTRQYLIQRNHEISQKYQGGSSIASLAMQFSLSEKSIQRIVREGISSTDFYNIYVSWCEDNLEKPRASAGFLHYIKENQKRYGLIYDAKCIGNRRGFHNVCKAEFTPVAGKTPFD